MVIVIVEGTRLTRYGGGKTDGVQVAKRCQTEPAEASRARLAGPYEAASLTLHPTGGITDSGDALDFRTITRSRVDGSISLRM